MSLQRVGVRTLPHSHGAAVRSLWSLHGPLQMERVKVNYVGESLSSLSFLCLSPCRSLAHPLTACGPGTAASQLSLCLSPTNKEHAAHIERVYQENL